MTNQREFDKTALQNKIKELQDSYKQSILNEEGLKIKLNVYRDQRSYETLNNIEMNFNLQDLCKQTNQLLTKKISVQKAIQKLKDNPELNSWVREGLDLHKNETECQFCGNTLPNDLFDRLNKHFSKEFDELTSDIQSLESKINDYKNELERNNFPDKARLYEQFQTNYETSQNNLKNYISSMIKSLDKLKDALNKKKNKPFDILPEIRLEDFEEKAKQELENLNEIIQQNNATINNLVNEKSKSKEDLLKHYSAVAIDDLEYFQRKKEIQAKKNEIQKIGEKIENLKNEINELKNKIAESNEGSEKVNRYLKDFFGDDQLKLKPLNDGCYQIYRNDKIAKNLSTGEKNIISLVYFITKLEEDNFNLKEAIVFIDDPVSSLDHNHTFKVYGFLSEKVLSCKQLFITTHNFEFFNLLKDLGKAKEYFLIKKVESNGQKFSVIEKLPEVLKKFQSEYNYLFSILKKFHDSKDESNFELLYILPNIARRFLEAYLFYKYPDGKKFKDKCELFFNSNESNKKAVLKLLDEYSHEQNPEHIYKFPDINELENSIKFILETLEEKDAEHYKALDNVYKLYLTHPTS
ncbi:MAG: AAA family ATPase [Leptospiraceae bacterium]|nr:AAA family ATPase [Leptospiraceae bacterium]